MGNITPRSIVTDNQMLATIKSLKSEIIAMAAKETNSQPGDWVVRDALPLTDFGFNKEKWENQTVFAAINTWQRDWDHELDDDTYVVFYGVILHDLNPTVYGVRFKVGSGGSTTIDTMHFQKLKEEDNVIGLFDKIIYKKEKHIYIELIADALTAQYGEEIELLCLVCEKYGEIVSGAQRVF